VKIANWVFVTGAPRSGTTFVGRTLSAPVQVDYIHEPFNPDCGIPGIDRRFLYLRPGVQAPERYRDPIDRLFRYAVRLRTGYYPEDSGTKRAIKAVVGSRGPFYYRIARLNPFHTAAVVKDPIGCLLTEYLAVRHGVRPVVLVRHPVAVAASVKRLKWKPDLRFLTEQPSLVEDFFAPEHVPHADLSSPVRAAAWEWWALNKVLRAQVARHPDWIVILHEELSREPVSTFRRLFRELDLPWSDRVERRIRRRTGSRNPTEARRGKTQHFSRDSRGLFDLRVGMLTPEERRDVFDITRDVALQLYSEDSFRLERRALK
jgi:hypothetical protein